MKTTIELPDDLLERAKSMTATEQQQVDSPRRMSGVLWDLFSGSASYTDVFIRTLHPAYVGNLLRNLVAANLPGGRSRDRRNADEGNGRVRH